MNPIYIADDRRKCKNYRLILIEFRIPCMLCVPAWSTCHRVKRVPTFCFYVPTWQRANKRACQCGAKFSTWRANVPKMCQFFNYFPKENIFKFLNFSIMVNICKFQEYLGNSRKFISQNKEFKF